MFSIERFQDALAEYKKTFTAGKWWDDERYKWEAVKCFQDNWDIDAADFSDMLKRSLEKTENLLLAVRYFPRGMILEFAQAYAEDTRAMFSVLFDESRDLNERMEHFKARAEVLLEQIGKGDRNHYQNENAVSIYLWLRYPEKYYIYKFSEVKKMASKLDSNYAFKMGATSDNVRNSFALYDEICAELRKDPELTVLLRSRLTDMCYPDEALHILTCDFCYFVSRQYMESSINPTNDMTPSIWKISHGTNSRGISDANKSLLEARRCVSVHSTTKPIGRSKKPQGEAFINDLKNGDYFYLCYGSSIRLLGRIIDDTPVLNPEMEDGWYEKKYEIIAESKDTGAYSGVTKWWTPNANSTCVEINADEMELFETLILRPYFDMTLSELFGNAPEPEETEPHTKAGSLSDKPDDDDKHGFWWLNFSPKIWSFSELTVGETHPYTLYSTGGNKRRVFKNFLDAKLGDKVICYESTPVKKVVGIAEISEEQDGEKISFKKLEQLVSPIEYQVIKDSMELRGMEFFVNANGSLFKLTEDEYNFLIDLIRDSNPAEASSVVTPYTKADFLDEVYMSEDRYNDLVGLLQNKKNVILQGAPGVGKTFAAQRLAYSMMGCCDDSRIEFVQFHQNYSYEDFVMGYKPAEDGFELRDGIFYRFCTKAANRPDDNYFFIIDEINRGEMSRIFGELLMLIERDYRGQPATLSYSGRKFFVPENIYIIGMMNTADRSLAMIDYALRRRFSFFNMEPGFDSEGFKKYQSGLGSSTLDGLIKKVQALNDEIANDRTLGSGFCIGHSYFCGQKTCSDEWLRSVVKYDIVPMLSEYWFDEPDKLRQWTQSLNDIFQ